MTLRITRAASEATPHDRLVAAARLQLPVDELPRIRATALAWRNGLAALLAGLVGFGLIKGRSDISQLQRPWPVVVGGLLVLSLLAGGAAAACLLRAAHGPPGSVDADEVIDEAADDPLGNADRIEALTAARALTWGVVLAYCCAALLVLAVGSTWYGPGKQERVQVVLPGGAPCGEVQKLSRGTLTLKTSAGLANVSMTQATGLRAVDQCPAPASP